MSIHVYTHVHTYVYTHVYTHAHTHAHAHAQAYAHVHGQCWRQHLEFKPPILDQHSPVRHDSRPPKHRALMFHDVAVGSVGWEWFGHNCPTGTNRRQAFVLSYVVTVGMTVDAVTVKGCAIVVMIVVTMVIVLGRHSV